MDTKMKVMISLGASYAAGCIPCFDHYYMLAKEQTIAEDDIKDIIAIARKVRNGSDIALEKAISDVVDQSESCVRMADEPNPCKCGV